MRRATTPTHIFSFPDTIEVDDVDELQIMYSQCGKDLLRKTLDDVTLNTERNALYLSLTQEESCLFAPGKALVQLRVKVNGSTMASQMLYFPVKPVLNSEEL